VYWNLLNQCIRPDSFWIFRSLGSSEYSKHLLESKKKKVTTCKIALGRQTFACSWTQPCSSYYQQYFQLQVGIPWNNKIMGKIVQPCNFITGYFSEWNAWDKKKAYTTKQDGILAAKSIFFKENKRKTVKSHLSETYHRFRFGVGHQTGKKILFVNLINNVSVVSHRYRHFLHHFGKVSARSTERDRWASRNEGGREEGRRRRELTSLPRPGPVEKFFFPLEAGNKCKGEEHTLSKTHLVLSSKDRVFRPQTLNWKVVEERLLPPRSHG